GDGDRARPAHRPVQGVPLDDAGTATGWGGVVLDRRRRQGGSAADFARTPCPGHSALRDRWHCGFAGRVRHTRNDGAEAARRPSERRGRDPVRPGPAGREHRIDVGTRRQQWCWPTPSGWVRDPPGIGRAPHHMPDLPGYGSGAGPGTAILAPGTWVERRNARRICGHSRRGRPRVSIAVAPAVVVERLVPMAGAVELVLYHPPSAVAVAPGQFFQLAVGAPHTILRRPYSAAWSDPASGRIGFIFNVVGAGSA